MLLKIKSKKIQIILLLLVAVGLGFTAYFLFLKPDNATIDDDNVEGSGITTSLQPTAQNEFEDGNDRNPVEPENEQPGTAIIIDNGGQITTELPEENWTYSDSGEITLYTPTTDDKLISGATVEGRSTLNVVNFRLIDNLTGVIAKGQISVKNGFFSGTLKFDTTASEGRLDLFGASIEGTEYSNIEIGINF